MKVFYCDGERYTEDEIDSLLDFLDNVDGWTEAYDDFEEYLNEEYEDVEICGETYTAANALYRVDEDRYNDIMNEWAEGEAEYHRDEDADTLNEMSDGDEEWIQGYKIECVYEDEDDEDEQEFIMKEIPFEDTKPDEDWNKLINNTFIARTL